MTAVHQWLFGFHSGGAAPLVSQHKFADFFSTNGLIASRAPRKVDNTLAVDGVDFNLESGPTWGAVVADYSTSGGFAINKNNGVTGNQYTWIFSSASSNSIALTIQGLNTVDGDGRKLRAYLLGADGLLELIVNTQTPASPFISVSYTTVADGTVTETYNGAIDLNKPITALFSANGIALAIDRVVVQTWAHTWLTVHKLWNTLNLEGGNFSDLSTQVLLRHIGVLGSTANTLTELQAQVGVQTVFTETFASGNLDDYTTLSGSPSMSVVAGVIGNAISMPSTNLSTVQRISKNLPAAVQANRLSWRVKSTDTHDDDGGIIQLWNAGTPVLLFTSKREGYYDALRRPMLSIGGVQHMLGASALVDGTWYRIDIELYPGSGNSKAKVYSAAGALLTTTNLTGDFTNGLTIDRVDWYMDASLPGHPTCGVQYEEIYYKYVTGG